MKYNIEKIVDAYLIYSATIEANSAEEAAEIAYYGERPIQWKRNGVDQFDACCIHVLNNRGEVIERLGQPI